MTLVVVARVAREPSPVALTPQPAPAALRQQVLANPVFKKLTGDAKASALDILKVAPTTADPSYYYTKLLLLLKTPDAPAAATSSDRNAEIDASLNSDKFTFDGTVIGWLKEIGHRVAVQSEEEILVSQRALRPFNGFYIDDADLRDVAIRVNVHLTGKPADIERVRLLEDKIEKHLRKQGFVVDLVFVDVMAKDAFDVGTDTTGWTNASNWVGSAEGLAHELCHLLGLPDEYDYIESHAANAQMKMADRLHWFDVQINRGKPPADANQGIMTDERNPVLERHVCEIARAPDEAACVALRKSSLTRSPPPAVSGLPPP